ncbi:MAG TPA: hypothetical protein VMV73_05985 [Candidatus Dormibacteraeota bacterium]|nr:hypothetical protein [Candidatus Dormibacteraeota bacterium]
MNPLSKALAGAILMLGVASISMPVAAQSMSQSYIDAHCGSWQGNTWVPNGSCTSPTNMYQHQYVAGTIVSVTGHLVTVQRSKGKLVIDDQLALNRQLTGTVAVGRRILAHGYWRNKVFYATMIQSSTVSVMAPQYIDSHCGAWQGNTWMPNGTCTTPYNTYKHQYVAGTIVSVTGHLVTVQRSAGKLVIDDQLALNRKMTGQVAVGRRILAHGYWRNKVFYATLIQ